MTPNAPTDPLAALKDIHLPTAIGQWPPAPGWWALAFLLVCALVAGSWWLWRRHKHNAYRRAALRELAQWQQQRQQHPNPSRDLQSLNQLLRRVVRHAYPKAKTAALSGSDWVTFLQQQGASDSVFQCLANEAYQAQPSLSPQQFDHLHRECQRWLRKHEGRLC